MPDTPPLDFVGGSIKKFPFPVRYIATPLFCGKNSLYPIFLNKRIFLYRKVRLRCTCFIPDTFRYTPVSDFSPVSRLFGCRSDCSTVPQKKIFRIMRNEYYTAFSPLQFQKFPLLPLSCRFSIPCLWSVREKKFISFV